MRSSPPSAFRPNGLDELHHALRWYGRSFVEVLISLMSVLMVSQLAWAASQNANVTPPTSPASNDANAQEHPYNGDDVTRPLNLLQLRYTYKPAPGATRTVTTHTMTLRADRRIDLSPDWQFAFRTDLPTLVTNPITFDNPEGHFRYGMGDAEFQAALIHDFNERWAAGFGAKLIAPTGTDDLASGKWQVMPGASFRVMLPKIGPDSYFVPLVRYDLSFAGDRSRNDISNLQFASHRSKAACQLSRTTRFTTTKLKRAYTFPTDRNGNVLTTFLALTERPLLAQSGHTEEASARSAFDPKRTSCGRINV
jgi:hypothetical protein